MGAINKPMRRIGVAVCAVLAMSVAVTTPAIISPAPAAAQTESVTGEKPRGTASGIGKGELSVAGEVEAGGLLTVSGSGFAARDPKAGFIALKINDGSIKLPEDQQGADAVDVDSSGFAYFKGDMLPGADGSFSGSVRIPKGLKSGAYWLRLLAGSDGGPAISKYVWFTVAGGASDEDPVTDGEPKGAPEPVNPLTDLNADNQGGMTLSTGKNAIVVSLPQVEPETWVYLSAYIEDSSQRLPWGAKWFKVAEDHTVTAPVAKKTLPVDMRQLVAQSKEGVVGWVEIPERSELDDAIEKGIEGIIDGAAKDAGNAVSKAIKDALNPKASPKPTPNNPKTINRPGEGATEGQPQAASRSGGARTARETVEVQTANGTQTVSRTTSSGTSSGGAGGTASGKGTAGVLPKPGPEEGEAPKHTPKPPAPRAERLPAASKDRISLRSDDTTSYVHVQGGKKDDWVYLYIYDPEPRGVGWARLNDKREFEVDLFSLADGEYTFAVVNKEGALHGWTEIALTGSSEAADEPVLAAQSQRVGPADWLVIIAALLLVEIAAIATVVYRRTRGQKGA